MSYKDYYRVLGVDRSVSSQELQRRYRALAKKYHPDVSKEPDAEARFKEIGEAYEVLKDPEKRSLYDKWGPEWRAISEGRGSPGGPNVSDMHVDFGDFVGGGGGFSDMGSIFEQVFGGRRSGSRGARRTRAKPPGADQETVLELGLEDAYRGGPRDLQFTDTMTGAPRTLNVTVPKGVRDGQRIRLRGQASGGHGDLFLRTKILEDERFRLDGDDVRTTLDVAPHEAVLGASASLHTLDGPVRVKVPPGSSTGRQIRLRERGYPKRGGGRGHLFAEIRVVVPSDPSAEERALYEELAKVSTFEPRDE